VLRQVVGCLPRQTLKYYYDRIHAVNVTRDPHNKLMISKLTGLLFSSSPDEILRLSYYNNNIILTQQRRKQKPDAEYCFFLGLQKSKIFTDSRYYIIMNIIVQYKVYESL